MYDFEGIRNHYQNRTPQIIEAYNKRLCTWYTPYSHYVDWPSMLSHIEIDTWFVLRSFGKCPMYPQYPVGKYFSDFGHPGPKIALECDGKEWHLDKEKDYDRDMAFERLGWTVFRIIGAHCVRQVKEYEELKESNDYREDEKYEILKEYYETAVEGVVKALAILYFDYPAYMHKNEIDLALRCLTSRITTNDELLIKAYERRKSKIVY